MESVEKLKQFVETNLVEAAHAGRISESENWLSNGMIDSIGVMQLVSFVEKELDSKVPDRDVTMSNFKSLKDVANYLEKRKQLRS